MDKLGKYQKIITAVLSDSAQALGSEPQAVIRQFIKNENNDNFVVLSLGWEDDKYYHSVVHHVQIIDNKVWIQQNNTDVDTAESFVKKGVCKNDIVLGFLRPYSRKVTDYAVA